VASKTIATLLFAKMETWNLRQWQQILEYQGGRKQIQPISWVVDYRFESSEPGKLNCATAQPSLNPPSQEPTKPNSSAAL